MSFSINTNTNAMMANLHSNNANIALDKSINSLSTGLAINSAADDASGLVIADSLSSQVQGLGQAMMNINDGIGMYQIADSAMNTYGENLDRIRTLTLKASNATMNDTSLSAIQKEIDGLLEASGQIASSTSYNGTKLLDGSHGPFEMQVGANSGDTQTTNIADASVESLVGSINIMTAEGREAALNSLDSAQDDVHSIRSTLGSSINELASTMKNISVTQVNTASAESQIRDVDFALESAKFSKANLSAQIGAFVQAQSNNISQNALALLK